MKGWQLVCGDGPYKRSRTGRLERELQMVQLPLGTVVALFCQSSEFCLRNPLCCFSTSNTKDKRIFRYRFIRETFGQPLIYYEKQRP
jgi:hypothetical protein